VGGEIRAASVTDIVVVEFGMRLEEIPNFEQLTDLERLQLAEELIASVRNLEALPAPILHRVELERRWAAYERNPATGLTEEQFWAQVQALRQ